MRRLCLLGALAGVLAACGDSTKISLANLIVYPILDSLFVGAGAPARTLIYLNDQGDTAAPVGVRWSSAQPAVASVDSVTGAVSAVAPGFTVITARVGSVSGGALVVVTKALDLQLLLDTIYLMQGDTFTVPVSVKRQGGAPPAAWFSAATNAVFTIDSASGRVTATAPGGPIRFVAHADSIADSGAVEVVSLSDTTGGKGYFTIFGTIIRRLGAATRAVNYARRGDTLTFRLRTALLSGVTTLETLEITSRDSVFAPVVMAIDSLTPLETSGRSSGFDPICRPLENWALWSTRAVTPNLLALSRAGGSITITRIVSIPHGQAISGRYTFQAQRTDEYFDPLGALPIRGTFVAPLVTDRSPCTS